MSHLNSKQNSNPNKELNNKKQNKKQDREEYRELSKKQILKKILYEPLIGRKIEVIDSKNNTNIGLKGIILFESKNDLIISTHNGEKRIRKDINGFKIEIEGKLLYMDGNLLTGTLINRIKKVK